EEHQLFQLTAVDQSPVPPSLGPETAADRLGKIEAPPFLGRRRGPLLFGGVGVAVAISVVVALVVSSSNSAPAHHSVRLRGNAVGVVDPKTLRLVASIPLSGPPTAIAAGLGSMWVAQS